MSTIFLNPKVTWRIEIVLDYFQSKFEGICRTVLEKSIKSNCTNLQDQPNDTKKNKVEWTVISMKLEILAIVQYHVVAQTHQVLGHLAIPTRSLLTEKI